jgi:septum site-determining protein MinD
VSEVLAVNLIGVIPEDDSVVISTNRGEPLSLSFQSPATRAFKDITDRLLGKDIPLSLPQNDEGRGFLAGLRKMFKL